MPLSSVEHPPAGNRAPIDSSAELCRLVLDAMPEPVLIVHGLNSTVRPMNIAARDWLSLDAGRCDEIRFGDIFPELNLATLPTVAVGFVLARVTWPNESWPREVVLKVFPLAPASSDVDEPATIAVIVRAVDSRAAARDTLPRDALDDSLHDSLTRLPNRRLFQRRLERALERRAHANYHFALLFVDLDGFKRVNDQLGHLEGDRLLLVAAHRMVEAVRPQDMVARRDGDEFTILLDDLVRPDDAIHIARRIIEHLQAPMAIEGASPVAIGASIGIAMGSDGTQTVDRLIAQADEAMYRAKKSGGNKFMLADGMGTPDDNAAQPVRRLPR